jgi:hypothetical protein
MCFRENLNWKKKTDIFLSDSNNNGDAILCNNEDFIQKVAYLVVGKGKVVPVL